MAGAHAWPDVRLLSFDLQSVKFAYADEHTLAITCADPLAPDAGVYDLRFGHAGGARNPHADAAHFVRDALRRAPLARALRTLVALLRATLPAASALADVRDAAERDNQPVETLVKGAGWYRIFYGDLRCAACDARVIRP
jgi:mediator of RNA polymerase II transcription subunit 14